MLRLRARRLWFSTIGLALVSWCGSAVWLDVPFVKQEKNGCGSASIAMLMRYWAHSRQVMAGAEADPRQIQRALYSQDLKGIRGADMERYFRRNGFQPYVFRGDWAELKRHIGKGRPLIACLKESNGASLHYVVVAGIDPAAGILMVNDPARRKLIKVDRQSFEKEWAAAQYWTLLAVPQPAR